MKKYRIEIVTKNDGTVEYYSQVRWCLIFWLNIDFGYPAPSHSLNSAKDRIQLHKDKSVFSKKYDYYD